LEQDGRLGSGVSGLKKKFSPPSYTVHPKHSMILKVSEIIQGYLKIISISHIIRYHPLGYPEPRKHTSLPFRFTPSLHYATTATHPRRPAPCIAMQGIIPKQGSRCGFPSPLRFNSPLHFTLLHSPRYCFLLCGAKRARKLRIGCV
jgi:hypothetical protein